MREAFNIYFIELPTLDANRPSAEVDC